MTERERLIDILNETIAITDEDTADYNEWLADELIENGVIVPPCKVGDTVYVNPETWGGLSFIEYDCSFIHSKHFLVAEVVSVIKTRKQNVIKLKVYNRTSHTYEYRRYSISSIGKTVFLTREEAEKALKERDDNG